MDQGRVWTREAWLAAAAERMAPWFAGLRVPLPGQLRMACGWPHGRRSASGRVVGECWSPKASRDSTTEVFVSPLVDDSIQVLGILTHELVHAAVGVEAGHQAPFRRIALELGLEGPMRATTVGPQLRPRLESMLLDLGAYPHAALTAAASGRRPDTTRLLKVLCPSCGYLIRTTAKWIDRGLPTCCCGTPMVRPDGVG